MPVAHHNNTTLEAETIFEHFRELTIGNDQFFETPFGEKPMVYADWVASGRLYGPIEERLTNDIGPFVGNTHTETSVTGTTMTQAYHLAREIIKQHVNADKNDVLIAFGSGMTSVINKFQRMLGLRIPEKLQNLVDISPNERPVVFITHIDRKSNQPSWPYGGR